MQLLILFLDSHQSLLLMIRFYIDSLQGVVGICVVGFGYVVGQGGLAVVVGIGIVGMVVGCIVGVVGVVGLGPVVVVSGLVPASKLLSLFGVLHRLAFEGIEFEVIDVFLQFVVFLLKLLH